MQFSSKTLLLAVLCTATFSLQAQTLSEKADMNYDLHAYRLAAQNYETVLLRDPEELATAAKLADAYYHLNDLQKAAKWYAVALKDANIKPTTVLQYGKVLMMLGKYNEATTQFKKYRTTDVAVADNYIKFFYTIYETKN